MQSGSVVEIRNVFFESSLQDGLTPIENHYGKEEIMNNNTVVKLNSTGPQGQEIFLAVDFTTRQASVLVVDPRNGNIIVTDVQSIATKGN